VRGGVVWLGVTQRPIENQVYEHLPPRGHATARGGAEALHPAAPPQDEFSTVEVEINTKAKRGGGQGKAWSWIGLTRE